MTEPVSGSRSSYSYGSHKKEIQNATEIIMEIENILQTKLNNGEINLQEFTTLSQKLNGIQKQYQTDQGKENKNQSQLIHALNDLKNEIESIAGGGATSGGSAKS